VAGHAVLVQERFLRVSSYCRGGGYCARACRTWGWCRGWRRWWSCWLRESLRSCRCRFRPSRLGVDDERDEQRRDAGHDK